MISDDTLISYNGWTLFADHILDFSKEYYKMNGVERLHNIDTFQPTKIEEGQIVFVKTDYIVDDYFYQYMFKHIKKPFKLITANSSYKIGSIGSLNYREILKSKNLIKWFSTNPPSENYDKIVPIPIGFEENSRPGGNQMLLNRMRDLRKYFWDKKFKVLLPYHNVSTNPDRQNLVEQLSKLEFVETVNEKQNMVDYLNTINEHRFVICLSGSGEDLHRIYETLLMGSVPILVKSSLKRMFEFYNLPVICVDSWNDLDKNFIEQFIAYPCVFESAFANVTKFLYSENYRKLFQTGVW